MRLPVNRSLPLAALILLGAAGAVAAAPAPQAPGTSGPAADYPVVVGEPFTIGSTVWTPTDQLNYDAVGNAMVGGASDSVTAAHKTLPLPSYVEVTSLESGRTVLVRVERRGPMVNDALIELSPGASRQLGIAAGASSPVRVRRVNPPEQERALLRTGQRAPERMETPEGLLKVLRRKLSDQSPITPPPSQAPAMPKADPADLAKIRAPRARAPNTPPAAKPPSPTPTVEVKARDAAPLPTRPASGPLAPKPKTTAPVPAPVPAPKSPPAQAAAQTLAKGAYVVQVAAFSSEASARKVAGQLGGSVSRSGKYWRVQLGPYPSRAKAAPALEKARNASYRDARILGAD